MNAYKDCSLNCFFCFYLGPPTGIQVTVLTSSSVTVTWSQSSSSGITSYLISYTTNASYVDNNERSKNIAVSTTSGTITNLEEDTLYTITVHATIDGNRASANSSEVSLRTYTDGKSDT